MAAASTWRTWASVRRAATARPAPHRCGGGRTGPISTDCARCRTRTPAICWDVPAAGRTA